MRILAVDIGGYTQDILLFDSSQPVENCFKMVMPSPTIILAAKIKRATLIKKPIFFTGITMGGGPSRKALEQHLKSGLKVFSTTGAATTFNDNVEEVARSGVTILPNGEKPPITDYVSIETRDLQLQTIKNTLSSFDIEPDFDGIAIAVLDHGAAPLGISDRIFRFQHLQKIVSEKGNLNAFIYLADEIPSYLTRMKAVAGSAGRNVPVLLLDTPVAAAIGSLEDSNVSKHINKIVINTGNFHTLAFHLQGDSILGFFEHHTEALNAEKLDRLVTRLVSGELTNAEVFDDGGHGCFMIESRNEIPFVSVTGPRRSILRGSKLKPYFAAPFGDMMLTGCFGLVRAFAHKMEVWQQEIEKSLLSSSCIE